MSTNHNRIRVADLETNQPNKILKTNQNGELEFSDANNLQAESYNALDCTTEGKTLDARQGKVLKDMIDNKTVNLATDAETQINTAISEDSKVISRSKLFNWWQWIKTQATTIAGDWIFTGSLKVNTNKEINLNSTIDSNNSSFIKIIHTNSWNENGIYLKTNGSLKLEGESLDINNSHFRGRMYDDGYSFNIDGQSIPLRLSGGGYTGVEIGSMTNLFGLAFYNNSELVNLDNLEVTYQGQDYGPFTSQHLNGMYPSAKKGFRVHCIYTIGGALCYEKMDTGYWAEYPVRLV